MYIREMSEDDLDSVSLLESENFSNPWTRQAFEEELKSNHAIYLVAIEDIIVGQCGMILYPDYGEIMNVCVRESCRHRGIAKQMLNQLILEAEKRGYSDFTLDVRASNIPAIQLYVGLGFHEEGRRPYLYQKPTEDGIIYWKRNKQ